MGNSRKDWLTRIRKAHNAFSEISFGTYYRTRLSPLLDNPKTTPKRKDVFKAFELVPFEKVKVVILGQDPYYQVSGKIPYATGLAFACNPKAIKNTAFKNLKSGKSLRTILKAIASELGHVMPDSPATDLEALAQEGVLLLNTALTTSHNLPKAHLKAWKSFTAATLLALNARKTPVYFVLTCESAKAFAPLIQAPHKIFYNYKHPSRCWRISLRPKQRKAEVCFFKDTKKQLKINWGVALSSATAT